ncbi:nucleic acid dioxygenase ALKBH1-like [Mytilus edulis]|uniref:nucleic acid dioxygenase ALKBH1-like n=1 Tax=Mytilus edulis TaxID=6550 RepID=UPI0039F0F945
MTDLVDNFKGEFKRYKQRNPVPNFSDVIDIEESLSKVSLLTLKVQDHPAVKGLKPVDQWKAYTLDSCPGFIIISNPFEDGGQRYWMEECIKTYPLAPNITNIDSHLSSVDQHDVWRYSKANYSKDITSKDSLMMKLRWVTLGYHYDWDNKKYYTDKHSEFPVDLSSLCKYIASVLGYSSFAPEAAIVNYYHMDSTLAGHTDHSELDHDAPLISISFGQDAIFLIGGLTKETKPEAIMLHSGDICIMSEQSRLVYHAVPRIMKAEMNRIEKCILTCNKCIDSYSEQTNLEHNKKSCDKVTDERTCYNQRKHSCDKHSDFGQFDRQSDSAEKSRETSIDEKLFCDYLNCTRINVNIRQVLKPNEWFPDHQNDLSCSVESKKLKLDTN